LLTNIVQYGLCWCWHTLSDNGVIRLHQTPWTYNRVYTLFPKKQPSVF